MSSRRRHSEIKIVNESDVAVNIYLEDHPSFPFPPILNLGPDTATSMLELTHGEHIFVISSDEGDIKVQCNVKCDRQYYLIVEKDLSIRIEKIPKEVLQKDFNAQWYSGRWYQIASIPQPFSEGCVRSIANYTLLQGWVQVYNECYDEDWKFLRGIWGRAIPINDPASLRVSFFNEDLSSASESYPNYLVHKTDYKNYALVGSPGVALDGDSSKEKVRLGFYILARTKSISRRQYEKLLAIAEGLGYDVSKIVADMNAVM